MVLIADERERTVGLVTIEDLVEELVGEIEEDIDPVRLPPDRRRVAGQSRRGSRRAQGGPTARSEAPVALDWRDPGTLTPRD